jgi:hypothetical protein
VHLPAQHRDLVAEDQEFDVFGSAVAASWVDICSTWCRSRYTGEALMAPGSLQLLRRRPAPDPHVNPAEPDLRARQPGRGHRHPRLIPTVVGWLRVAPCLIAEPCACCYRSLPA